MKKNLQLLVICICLCGMAHAQPGKTMYGIKGGLNLPNIKGLHEESMTLTTFHGGLFYNFAFAPQSRGRAQFELLYSAQGADLRDNKQEIRLNYLALPISLQLGLGRSDRPFLDNVYLEGGMQFGYLSTAKMKNTETKESVDLQDYYTTKNPDAKLSKIDAAVFGGIGINLSYTYQISCRYLYGLNSFVNSSSTEYDFSNSVFQLSMAFAF
ncbi:PorT family protein [Sphingobacterium sp. DN00404]|uniref:PorT family protein n=1 Tax=Sphingobacterium micropteri TaxID=2763501 RepID=A0ABR7YRL2_9SPHI|nr:outer membrane beta-barrel protein [Sphingobacterium micropteri]MBD1433932.1 PorT family protein [Sphingobacterium micropteri]